MNYNYYRFEDKTSLFPKGYTNLQHQVINAILGEANDQGITLKTQLAYLLCTPYHEAYNWNDPNSRMTQLTEMGGDVYLKGKKYYPFYGRGFSHLTWQENYEKESKRLGIDLVSDPDRLLDIPTAANSHVYCMKNGVYTGKKLSDYLTTNKTDFPNARRIINGTDQAEKIAGYAMEFMKLIS